MNHTVAEPRFARTTGVREAALGANRRSIAIGRGRGGGRWVWMLAVSDAGDALVSLLTPGLPARARVMGVFAAASSGIARLAPHATSPAPSRSSGGLDAMNLRGRLLVRDAGSSPTRTSPGP